MVSSGEGMGEKSGSYPTWAPMALVDRYHQEDNQWKAAHMQLHARLDEKVAELVKTQALIDQRLNTGAETFQEVRGEFEKLRPPIWKTALFVLAILGSVIGTVGSVVWFAAKTPSQTEVNRLREKVEDVRVQAAEMNGKLDRVLQAQKP